MQVFSNLPGPTEQLVFCGETVTGMQIIFPNLIPQVYILCNALHAVYSVKCTF